MKISIILMSIILITTLIFTGTIVSSYVNRNTYNYSELGYPIYDMGNIISNANDMFNTFGTTFRTTLGTLGITLDGYIPYIIEYRVTDVRNNNVYTDYVLVYGESYSGIEQFDIASRFFKVYGYYTEITDQNIWSIIFGDNHNCNYFWGGEYLGTEQQAKYTYAYENTTKFYFVAQVGTSTPPPTGENVVNIRTSDLEITRYYDYEYIGTYEYNSNDFLGKNVVYLNN